MPRYVMARQRSRPRADWMDDDSPMIANLEVDCLESVDTGLVTETGEAIYRMPSPIGFGRDDEW